MRGYNGVARFPTAQENWSGEWVFKLSISILQGVGAKEARSQLKATLRAEFDSILARRQCQRVDNYILITDVPLTSASRKALAQVVLKTGFTDRFHAIDGQEVCEF